MLFRSSPRQRPWDRPPAQEAGAQAGAAPEGPGLPGQSRPTSRGGGGGQDTSWRSQRAPRSREEGRRAPPPWAGLWGPLGAGQSPGPCNCWQSELKGTGRAGGRQQSRRGGVRGPAGACGWRGGHSETQPGGSPGLWPVSPLPAVGWKGAPGALSLQRGAHCTSRETAQPSAVCPPPKKSPRKPPAYSRGQPG